jgi:hypothetical protein
VNPVKSPERSNKPKKSEDMPMSQPVPNVTDEDVKRIALRDFRDVNSIPFV